MNYRHHFHAGNFADVVKHALLVPLLRGLQRKEKGFLYLDTHAGRGRYDLSTAARGDTLERRPEWPEGIGRLWNAPADRMPAFVAEYLRLVRGFGAGGLGGASPDPVADRDKREQGGSAGADAIVAAGGAGVVAGAGAPRFYPGSPWLAHALARPQDRLFLCEQQPDECARLDAELAWDRRVAVRAMDGYTAIRAALPPAERRALVLIDPPFEAQNEFAQIVDALDEGLQRLPGGTFAVWYPLTERARADAFLFELERLNPPPTFTAELEIVGPASPVKMKGCGLAVINPPWQIDREIAPALPYLAEVLAQERGGGAGLRWLVPER